MKAKLKLSKGSCGVTGKLLMRVIVELFCLLWKAILSNIKSNYWNVLSLPVGIS